MERIKKRAVSGRIHQQYRFREAARSLARDVKQVNRVMERLLFAAGFCKRDYCFALVYSTASLPVMCSTSIATIMAWAHPAVSLCLASSG